MDYRKPASLLYRQGRLPKPGNARESGFHRRSVEIVDVTRQSWVLANQNRRLRQVQDDIHIAFRTVHIFINDVWSEQRPKHVPTCVGHNIVYSRMAVFVRIPERGHHLLQVHGRTLVAPTDCTSITFETQPII